MLDYEQWNNEQSLPAVLTAGEKWNAGRRPSIAIDNGVNGVRGVNVVNVGGVRHASV
jgi:hypothetical protein